MASKILLGATNKKRKLCVPPIHRYMDAHEINEKINKINATYHEPLSLNAINENDCTSEKNLSSFKSYL